MSQISRDFVDVRQKPPPARAYRSGDGRAGRALRNQSRSARSALLRRMISPDAA